MRGDLNEVEADYLKVRQISNSYQPVLPFRLTPNLVFFMGQIGLHGIFAGVMTSASLALTAHENKLSSLLRLVFSDEITSADEAVIQTKADLNA